MKCGVSNGGDERWERNTRIRIDGSRATEYRLDLSNASEAELKMWRRYDDKYFLDAKTLVFPISLKVKRGKMKIKGEYEYGSESYYLNLKGRLRGEEFKLGGMRGSRGCWLYLRRARNDSLKDLPSAMESSKPSQSQLSPRSASQVAQASAEKNPAMPPHEFDGVWSGPMKCGVSDGGDDAWERIATVVIRQSRSKQYLLDLGQATTRQLKQAKNGYPDKYFLDSKTLGFPISLKVKRGKMKIKGEYDYGAGSYYITLKGHFRNNEFKLGGNRGSRGCWWYLKKQSH